MEMALYKKVIIIIIIRTEVEGRGPYSQQHFSRTDRLNLVNNLFISPLSKFSRFLKVLAFFSGGPCRL